MRSPAEEAPSKERGNQGEKKGRDSHGRGGVGWLMRLEGGRSGEFRVDFDFILAGHLDQCPKSYTRQLGRTAPCA